MVSSIFNDMVDIEGVNDKDLYKKHNNKELLRGFYSIWKEIYQVDDEVLEEGFALDK